MRMVRVCWKEVEQRDAFYAMRRVYLHTKIADNYDEMFALINPENSPVLRWVLVDQAAFKIFAVLFAQGI